MVIRVSDIIQQQRQFFATGKTKDVDFRIEQLKNLKSAIASNESRIVDAVNADLNKPEYEAYFEIATIADINYAIKNVKSWAKPKKVPASIDQFPASARIYPETFGRCFNHRALELPISANDITFGRGDRRRQLRHPQTF